MVQHAHDTEGQPLSENKLGWGLSTKLRNDKNHKNWTKHERVEILGERSVKM